MVAKSPLVAGEFLDAGGIMKAGLGFSGLDIARSKGGGSIRHLVVCELAHKPVLFGCYTRECSGFRRICAESKPTSKNMAAESASRGG